MTALDRYAKLEAVARYLEDASGDPLPDGRADARADASARGREVVLSFGERSLVIVSLDDRAIAHWPLASLRALGPPGERPLELVPDRASKERVLLDDPEMCAAIAEVCPALHSRPKAPPRRWLRPVLWAAATAGLAALGALVVVPALPDRITDLVPPGREAALGEAVAARLPALIGAGAAPPLCVAEEGSAALRTLAARLAPAIDLPFPLRLSVLDHPRIDALTLPGGRIVILRGLLDRVRTPEELAAVLAHAAGHARLRDPLEAALDRPGLGAASILAGNVKAASAVRRAAEAVLGLPQEPQAQAEAEEAAADAVAFATLAAAGLPTWPLSEFVNRLTADAGDGPVSYLSAHPWSEPRAARAAEADTVGKFPFRPALRDSDWIALGSICDRTAPARRVR